MKNKIKLWAVLSSFLVGAMCGFLFGSGADSGNHAVNRSIKTEGTSAGLISDMANLKFFQPDFLTSTLLKLTTLVDDSAPIERQITELVNSITETPFLNQVFLYDDTVLLDFDSAIRKKYSIGVYDELLLLKAIIDTIAINVPVVKSVQVMFDGGPSEVFINHVDISRPLFINDLIISKIE